VKLAKGLNKMSELGRSRAHIPKCSPADGTNAAFAITGLRQARWQLSNKRTPIAGVVKGSHGDLWKRTSRRGRTISVLPPTSIFQETDLKEAKALLEEMAERGHPTTGDLPHDSSARQIQPV
jgi:hypothetical protein